MNTLLDARGVSKIAEYYGTKQKIKRELQALSLSFITFKELKCIIYLCCDKLSTINDIIDELNIFMRENCLNDNTGLNLFGVFGVGSKSEIGVMLSIGNEKLFVGTAPVTKPFPKKKPLPEKKRKESFLEKLLKFFKRK